MFIIYFIRRMFFSLMYLNREIVMQLKEFCQHLKLGRRVQSPWSELLRQQTGLKNHGAPECFIKTYSFLSCNM